MITRVNSINVMMIAGNIKTYILYRDLFVFVRFQIGNDWKKIRNNDEKILSRHKQPRSGTGE